MNKTPEAAAAAIPKKKGGAGKTFLSVVFFILILACAYILAKCMSAGAMNNLSSGRELLEACSVSYGKGLVNFISGALGFWCSLSAVILWFGLWIASTRRIASAIRGLGVACSVAALVQLIGQLIFMLLTCVFSMESILLPFKEDYPGLFADTCGNNVIFALCSMMIAAFGIFICKLKKLPKKGERTTAPGAEPASAPVPQPVPAAAVSASEAAPAQPPKMSSIDIDVTHTQPAHPLPQEEPMPDPDAAAEDIPAAQPEELLESLAGVCHMCNARNHPDMNFCGHCGAKLK
ncbi:MAG: hypothetical protein IJ496_06155 [Ruminococcus sp.]|nr:hypothetical protein [Ruminococcus sp.]